MFIVILFNRSFIDLMSHSYHIHHHAAVSASSFHSIQLVAARFWYGSNPLVSKNCCSLTNGLTNEIGTIFTTYSRILIYKSLISFVQRTSVMSKIKYTNPVVFSLLTVEKINLEFKYIRCVKPNYFKNF